ncbi:MAG: hypothetical protein WA190_09490 [Usitatibacter sp.]
MKRGSIVFFALWIATSAASASAQSPFAGTWTGTQSVTGSQTCSCSGTSCSGGSTTVTCSFSQPWTGTVDSQGNLSVNLGAGTETCNPGSVSLPIDPSGPIAEGLVPANGTLSVAPQNTSNGGITINCGGYAEQFSSSGVTGNYSCTISSTSSGPGITTTCTGSDQYVLNASPGSGNSVLVPPKVVFPITVNSAITSTNASATAQVSPPAQQVGTQGSVFVFAHARLSALTPHADKRFLAPPSQKDGGSPDPCVLAQLNSSGQLTASSASSLQAYTSGVLASQSQSVTILNNVPTPNVAGATFLVGYGANSGSMLTSGNYEGAVSVNGSSPCSAALLAGAAPSSPSALTGLWWNPNENGWGISFTQRRNVVFGAWYTYDSGGNPKWYVAPDCEMPAGITGTNGTCTGALYQVTGPTFFGTAFNASLDNVVSVGNLSVAFQDANTATMTYSVNGQGRTVSIIRQVFQPASTPPAIDYSDLWWNPNESGWGMTITQQYGVMFLAWYVYNGSGNPVWYVAPDCVVVGSACSGSVYSTTGPPLGPSFNPGSVVVSTAGTITATFLDANNATISYTVNGVSSTKQITRQNF